MADQGLKLRVMQVYHLHSVDQFRSYFNHMATTASDPSIPAFELFSAEARPA